MSNLKIRDFTFYSFVILIIGLLLSTVIVFFFLQKIDLLNKKLTCLSNSKNSFLELKMNTENLLSTLNLEDKKIIWIKSIEEFDKQINTLTLEQKNRIGKLWYISKKEISKIDKILENNILQPQNLHKKSILSLQGELFIKDKNSELYKTILSLSRKIEFLLQYQDFIFQEFKKMDIIDKKTINKQIENMKIYSIFSSTIILIIVILTILIINKKITKIEKKLIKSQSNLSKKIEELQEAKLLLNNIIDSIPIAIFWKNTDFKYLGANKYFLNLAGYQVQEQIIGKTDFKLPWNTKDIIKYRKDDKSVIETGKHVLKTEESLLTKNKNRLDIITSKVPLTNTKGEIIGILGIFMDITDIKKMNEELDSKNKMIEQQSKMAAMGEMLENIAHQWRQPLSVISSSATGIKVKKEFEILDDEFLDEAINRITNSVNHLNQTIEDFRNYFKPDKKLTYFDIEECIEKVLFLTQSKIKNRDISIIKNLQKIKIFGLKNEFIQVIINIINNCIDALEEKNKQNKYIFFDSKVNKETNEITLEITDNADGIPENIINKIFNPYFTTKSNKNGTGIGLYMSKEMITKHMNGTLTAKNIEYSYNKLKLKGAKFILSIPIK
ncbi:hypothetical protein CPU12_09040 [Malaciobacter molluscorum LMG 25693]|uniref:histidine kinase n=1 Tax=Malaciobacter molluscorum LMG 25693 TaxID=870501 RepID=A0A2G1DGU7_9BACT|nr:PAS domain-containing sensor histidine kinase [Malaciobacter molluscorum]AXX92286.1 PAS sensor-containing signal transduction histidine kinase [Malaciobacter molluscorum LMG 25693]PHO17729.1 hypothetical protein CPU12_09040 [Malaciobacter molluscorum LMG 25693]